MLYEYKFYGQIVKELENPETYVGINPHGPYFFFSSAINDTTIIMEGEAKNYLPVEIERSSTKLAFTKDREYLYTSVLFKKCRFPGLRSAILKVNLTEYCAELFYEDPTENCLDSRSGVLGIDLYDDDYIYFINEAEACDSYPGPGFNPSCYTDYVYLRCLDKKGNLRWSKYLGGDANYSECSVVATPDSGCLVLAIRYEHGVNLNYSHIDSMPTRKIETDSYYLKFDKNGNVAEPLTTTVTNNTLENAIEIYPNPVNDFLNIHLPELFDREATVEIFNLKGQLVLSEKWEQKPIAVHFLAKGHYTYAINQATQPIFSGKFIKL